MSSCCRSVDGEVLVFACAGAAYCGQLIHRAALDLTKEGVAQMFCLSAIAAGKEDKLVRTRGAGMRIALDGCEDHCARRVLENAGVPVDLHVVVTDLGIERQTEMPHFIVHGRRIVENVCDALNGRRKLSVSETDSGQSSGV